MRAFGSILLLLVLGVSPVARQPAPGWLGAPERVADGVDLYRVDATDLVSPGAPQSVRLLRVDPKRARLRPALAGTMPSLGTVQEMAARDGAVAAVNAGFFLPTGDPAGVLRIDGRLVSDTTRARGAVALLDEPGEQVPVFDQVTAVIRLRFRSAGAWRSVRVDGVDSPRRKNRVTLYSPSSGPATPSEGGLEWSLTGTPLRASAARRSGRSAIPVDGFVVSFGGLAAPAALAGLARASSVQVRQSLTVASGERVRDWIRAPQIVGGAGLLVRRGVVVTDWTREKLSPSFDLRRHPRTVIARDASHAIWLVTVDGRQPSRAAGMSFAELHALLARLGAIDALNLDGGGSTTMVANGQVVNLPSDLTGARRVSDALLVIAGR
ncbi:MAG: phosphodiester glycosidase family protein [Acidobacteria bacterium]|nr:phosphodiester glycosidase family protein [Acidobacteriota bacterium]